MKNIPYYTPEICDGHYCPMDCEDGHCPWAEQAMERFYADNEENADPAESPYAEWLEGSIKAIMALRPDTMGLVAIRNEDEMAITSYFRADSSDMVRFIGQFASDYIMDIIQANIANIHNMLIEEENDDIEDGDDENE